jgi:hypothetical protein
MVDKKAAFQPDFLHQLTKNQFYVNQIFQSDNANRYCSEVSPEKISKNGESIE